MEKKVFNISPDSLRVIKHNRCLLAKHLLNEAKRGLGGEFLGGKRIIIRRMVCCNDCYVMEVTRQAFDILKRYFRMKFGRVEYEEYSNGFEMYFTIAFYTPNKIKANLSTYNFNIL